MNSQITVIITTFNRKAELKRALQSVFDQTIQPYEILIINNGYENLNLEEITHLSGKNIKIINSVKNFHAGDGRNLGASIATTDYLAFLDDDDFWEQDYIKKTLTIINKDKPDLLISTLYDLDTNNIYKKINNLNLSKMYTFNPGINGSNIVVLKKSLKEVDGYNNSLFPSEDKALVIDFILKNKKIVLQDNKVFCNINSSKKTSRNLELLEKGTKNFIKYYNKNFNLIEKIMINHKLSVFEIKNKKYLQIFKFLFLYLLKLLIRKN